MRTTGGSGSLFHLKRGPVMTHIHIVDIFCNISARKQRIRHKAGVYLAFLVLNEVEFN